MYVTVQSVLWCVIYHVCDCAVSVLWCVIYHVCGCVVSVLWCVISHVAVRCQFCGVYFLMWLCGVSFVVCIFSQIYHICYIIILIHGWENKYFSRP